MKKVLIIGKDSYIGESFKRWLEKYPNEYVVDIVNPKNGEWKQTDFSRYETVVDFAGIAHVKNITDDMKDLFYSVNRDLTYEFASWSKEHGVEQFIVFSSMNVYGDFCGCVSDRTAENPTSFYGDSKLQGDKEISKLEDNKFIVSYLRPPFVYGKGCKGNYNFLSYIAKKTPVFPTYKNKKSMIYIDNLCEFVRLVIDNRLGGILTPQNRELVSTSDLVAQIAKVSGKKIWFTGLFNWMIKPLSKFLKVMRRAFDDDCYVPEISDYWDNRYCMVSFEESIKLIEKK